MKLRHIILPLLWIFFSLCGCGSGKNKAAMLSQKGQISWWHDAKFGMFIHWGLYAIPAGTWKESVHERGYSEWIMYHEQIPVGEYEKLAKSFNPVQFDAETWVKTAKAAGMKYIVITSKHHDGFSMFDSDVSDYNIVDATPFGIDVIKELAEACRTHGLKFGCYYSIDRDWHHPLCPSNDHHQDNYWDYPDPEEKNFTTYLEEYAVPQIRELLTKYQPDILWFDGIGMKTNDEIARLYSMVKSLQPNCIVNSRINTYTFPRRLPPPYCDYLSTGDNVIADELIDFGWENPGTMNTSYGYNKNDQNWRSADMMVKYLVDIVSKGGNYLLNVGPTDLGVFPEPAVNRLKRIGEWLDVNGEAIYNTRPFTIYGERPEKVNEDYRQVRDNELYTLEDIRFTTKEDTLFAILLGWPYENAVIKSLGSEKQPQLRIKNITMLGSDERIIWKQSDKQLELSVPAEKPGNYVYVYKLVCDGLGK